MNCKPGDLAVVVRALCEENLGCLVRVERVHVTNKSLGLIWKVTPDRPRHGRMIDRDVRTPAAATGWHPDAWLRPIRDPGEDARDETLSWLPVPAPKREVLALPLREMGRVQ